MMPAVEGPLLRNLPIVDEILHGHALAIGEDFVGYRNHVYRVVNLCVTIVGDRNELEKVAVAAVFHDIGIWTNQTFDYIAPSVALARAYLMAQRRDGWIGEIEQMIGDHHKITRSTAKSPSLVEAFRRADWADVTGGLRKFEVPRSFIGTLFTEWPSAGFHWRLVMLTLQRFRTHPLTPLPMVRL